MELVEEKSLGVDVGLHPNKDSTSRELAERIERRIDLESDGGDAMIVVEDSSEDEPELHGLLVSSDMMARASEVWKRMFRGEWAETQAGQPLVLGYREDGYVVVLIVMNIIHLRFVDVPTAISLDELRDIAMFTDKWMVTLSLYHGSKAG
ncbi:nuclear pore protein [Colletotrichum tofieldiae]|nr:nuclear pore protein [Colletotrichum tofieldiae]